MIFYESFYDAIRELPDAERLAAYDAICGYGCTGEEPEVSGIVRVIFTLVRPQIDANERRAAAGKKGGRPRKPSGALENDPPEDSDRGGKPENDSGADDDREEIHEETHEETHEEIHEDPPPQKKQGRKREKEPRHRYGANGKVMLSDRDLEKLKAEFPDDWKQWIDRVDGYCQQMGKTYSDYLQTIRNWSKKDREKNKGTGKVTGCKNRFDNFTPSDNDYSIFESII